MLFNNVDCVDISLASAGETSSLVLLTVGDGGKGVLPMVPRRMCVIRSIQASPVSRVLASGGDSGRAMRGSSEVYVPVSAGNAGQAKEHVEVQPAVLTS